MPYSSDVEEQLARQQEEEERRRAEMEEIAQLERMAAQQEQPLDEAKQLVKQKAKQLTGQLGKRVVSAAARGLWTVLVWIGSALAATFPIWGPIVLCLFVLVALVSVCNSSYLDSPQVAGLKLTVAAIPGDICGDLSPQGHPSRSGGAGGGTKFGWDPADLVALSGVSVDPQTSDPRVRQCMFVKVQQIFNAAAAARLNITVTSAYRSDDFPSRHAYGEAVDIAIRPASPNQQQIARLVQIGRNAGFTPPAGDTIDEYNNPTERTSGGHVHVEFNGISATESNCAPYPNPPAPA